MSKEVIVREVEYLSKDAEEALVYLTDGVYECAAFCQPCDKVAGDLIKQLLVAFGTQGVEIANSDVLAIKRIGSTFGYEVCAEVIDVDLRILKVGSILLELDVSLPGGSQQVTS